ncbi:hypothetical protein KIPB_003688, partial [Kipferlia bialata]|eukprot:g3688.t1
MGIPSFFRWLST